MKDRGRRREWGREARRIKKKETVKESLSTGRVERDLNKGRSAGKLTVTEETACGRTQSVAMVTLNGDVR